MTRFAARSTYTFAWLAFCVLLIVADLIWAFAWVVEQRSTHWAVDRSAVLIYFFQIVLLGIGGISLIGLALTDLVDRSLTWWTTASAVAIVAALANIADSSIFFGERGWVILHRDLVSIAVSAILITVVVAWLCRWLRNKRTGAFKLVAISGGAMILVTHLFLFASFIVHCSSGDCL